MLVCWWLVASCSGLVGWLGVVCILVVNGEWWVVGGEWCVIIGYVGCWLSTVCCRWAVVSGCRLAVWRLFVGLLLVMSASGCLCGVVGLSAVGCCLNGCWLLVGCAGWMICRFCLLLVACWVLECRSKSACCEGLAALFVTGLVGGSTV